MTNQHPINPPPELLTQWRDEFFEGAFKNETWFIYLANKAARWGANQELEACVKLLTLLGCSGTAVEIRAARRPKPPTLKEQALLELDSLSPSMKTIGVDTELLRRAIEALPND